MHLYTLVFSSLLFKCQNPHQGAGKKSPVYVYIKFLKKIKPVPLYAVVE